MSTQVIAQESTIKIYDIPMKEIFSDANFNCRGQIAPIDVVDLARDIDKIGLQSPIIVQPYRNPLFLQYKYRIVSGHRRHKAMLVLSRETIPSIIKEGLSETEARTLNLSENLKRKDLNLLQEAKAIMPYKNAGFTQDEVSKELGMSRGWVQIRYNLLDLPEDIQNEAAAGFISQEQIKDIYSLPPSERYEAVRKIKEARQRGEKRLKVSKPKKRNAFAKKARNKYEIFAMMEQIQETVGNGFHTRCMAWAAGTVSDFELYRDLKKFAEERGIQYEIPKEIMSAL